MKNGKQRGMKVWQLVVGLAVGVLVFCLPLLIPDLPMEGKMALFIIGLAIMGVVLGVFVSQRGGVRCPNCGGRCYGRPMAIAARTHEGIFRCPQCGTMINLK